MAEGDVTRQELEHLQRWAHSLGIRIAVGLVLAVAILVSFVMQIIKLNEAC